MYRSRPFALLIALVLFANPVLACCSAMHEGAQSSATALENDRPCHGGASERVPPPEPCAGCAGCELVLTGIELPAEGLVLNPYEPPVLMIDSHHGDELRNWARRPPSTGPPADPLRPAETPVQRYQLLLL